MSRKITVKNPNHPKNMMDAVGQSARKFARNLSNKALDQWFRNNIEAGPLLNKVLTLTRSKKIKAVQDCAMLGFAEKWNKSVDENGGTGETASNSKI